MGNKTLKIAIAIIAVVAVVMFVRFIDAADVSAAEVDRRFNWFCGTAVCLSVLAVIYALRASK